MNKRLLVLLRCLAKGDKEVLEIGEDYCNIEVKDWKGNEGAEIKTIESRLQYELFGEYPLSGGNVADWYRIKSAFRFQQ